MKYSVKVTGKAEADIDEVIERFAALPGPTVADWAERLRATIKDLAYLPRRYPVIGGRSRKGLQLRVCRFGKRRGAWDIYYSIDEEIKRVTVWTIQRAARGPFRPGDLV